MPRAATARKKKKAAGGGGRAILVVVVVLVIAGVGGYLWNQASAKSAASRFVEAGMALIWSTNPDFTEVKKLVCKADVKKLEEAERALGAGTDAWGPESGGMPGNVTFDQEVGKASVGFSEATVEIKVTTNMGGMSHSQDTTVVLVREGLGWKVSVDRTDRAGGIPEGEPRLVPGVESLLAAPGGNPDAAERPGNWSC
jgi:hypothetical protein